MKKQKFTIASAIIIGIVVIMLMMIVEGTSLTGKFYAPAGTIGGTPTPGQLGGGTSGGMQQGGIIIAPAPENSWPACGDGRDNDKDGLTDCNDPDCTGQVCAVNQCPVGSVGVGQTGTCPQPQMFQVKCNLGKYVCTETFCSDGIDNDLDGGADFRDYDCPHMDLLPVSVEKTASYVNESVTLYDYKVTFKNAGTLSVPPNFPNPPPIITYVKIILYNAENINQIIGYIDYQAPVLAGQTVFGTVIGATADASKVKVWVDFNNIHPEPDENNNIAIFDV